MKIKTTLKRYAAFAVVATAFLAYSCTSDQQEQEDIVYSDQPQQQEQQEVDLSESEDGTGGESVASIDEGAEGEDLVSDYQEELTAEDNPVSSGIADSAAEASAGNDGTWNSSTNDYSYGDSYTGNTGSTATDTASAPTQSEPSLNYQTEPAYTDTTTSYEQPKKKAWNKKKSTWKKKSSKKWAKSSSNNSYGQGYNDNLSTDLSGNQRLYIVQKGDTLSSIAHKIYGDAGLWSDLAQTNNINNANAIYPGDPIKFASNNYSKDFEATYDNIAKNTVTVQSGDTLSSIARQVLGDSGEWKFLYTMNKTEIADPNTISPNQVLYYYTRENFTQAFQQSNIKERFGH